MCGLVGVMGLPNRSNRKVFEDMLCIDWRRGPHSTGIAFINQKESYILKDTELPWDLLRTSQYMDVPTQHSILMGHNRFATVGDITADNAHPFTHEHITLTHNGTLKSPELLTNHENFDTDSESICHSIATEGIDVTYKKLHGAWALVWWDSKQRSLNIISNGQRTLFFQYEVGRKSLYWASERLIFDVATEVRDKKMEKTYFNLTDHHLYSFFFKKHGKITMTDRELDRYIVPAAPYGSYYYGHNSHYDKLPIASHAEAKNKNESMHGTAHERLSEETYVKAFEDATCVFCHAPVVNDWEFADLVGDDDVVCGECNTLAKTYDIKFQP